MHETFYREDVDKINLFKSALKGELTIVISENKPKNEGLSFNEESLRKKAKRFLKKYSVKDVANILFETEKVNKKRIYQICLDIRKSEKNS